MKRIKLYRTQDGWLARFYNAPEVVAAMGTDIIPTAYTAQAKPETVLSAIRRLNPGVTVELAK